MNRLTAWLAAKPRKARIRILVAATLAAWAVMIALGFAGAAGLAPLLGGAMAIVLAAIALLTWRVVLDDAQRERFDVRERMALPSRRYAAIGAGAVWIIAMLVLRTQIPSVAEPAVGTLNVLVLIALFMAARATPMEVIDAQINADEAAEARENAYDAMVLDPDVAAEIAAGEAGTANARRRPRRG